MHASHFSRFTSSVRQAAQAPGDTPPLPPSDNIPNHIFPMQKKHTDKARVLIYNRSIQMTIRLPELRNLNIFTGWKERNGLRL